MQSTRHILRALTLWRLIALSATAAGSEEVSTAVITSHATLQNDRVGVTFELQTGTYSAWDKRSGRVCVSNAVAVVRLDNARELRSDTGYSYKAAGHAITDPLGKGRTLTLRGTAGDRPDLILQLTLHAGSGAILLGAGVRNTLASPIQVMDLAPVANASLFPGTAGLTHCKTLDGAGGAAQTSVKDGLDRQSPNNLLLTCLESGTRRSLVMGALTSHDFAKWFASGRTQAEPRGPGQARVAELAQCAATAGAALAAYLDCGRQSASDSAPAKLVVLTGRPYEFPSDVAPPCYSSVLFDEKRVTLKASGLDPAKTYALGFSWWDQDNNGRQESVRIRPPGSSIEHTLVERQSLPAFIGRGQMPEQRAVLLPAAAYASGALEIAFANDASSPNAVASEVWLWECPGGRLPGLPAFPTQPDLVHKSAFIGMRASDPVGKRVDPGVTYVPDDLFYLDFSTADPFLALERYGLSVRTAQPAAPNIYDFPTVCAWYVQDFCGGPKVNNTAALVGEMEEVRKTGFLKYSPVALRLVPDKYNGDTEQGWWDDAHWRAFGHYTAPYDTSDLWCQAVRQRGGLPFTYFQTGMPSDDYARAFPGHMLANDIAKLAIRHPHHQPLVVFDYTDPGFQAHLKQVWRHLGKAGLAGVMFDYPETGWRPEGGFEDEHATTAAAYRSIYQLARAGLGPKAFLHERLLGESWCPLVDVSAGLVDSQRVWGDTSAFDPTMVQICGLRWYKTRVLYSYDMDAKSLLFRGWGQQPVDPQTLRRSVLTMLYVTAGRVLLADSFRELSPEMRHELSRIFPIHAQPRSARPLDAFTGAGVPRVYDFAVNPDWHQLTFFNPDFKSRADVSAPLSGEAAAGGLGLDPAASYYAYDFWNDTCVGRFRGSDVLAQTLRPGEARMMSVHKVLACPQFLSANRHLMQGYVDMPSKPAWTPATRTLTGTAQVIGGETYTIVVAANGYRPVRADAGKTTASLSTLPGPADTLLRLDAPRNTVVRWKINFDRP